MAPIFLALAPLLTSLGGTAAAGTAAAGVAAGVGGAAASTSILGSLASAATWIGSHATLLAGVAGGAGSIYAGVKAKQAADAEALSMKRKGDDEFAIGQRNAMKHREETRLLLSRERAVAAASGGAATDPTVTAIMGKTQQEGDYNAMIDMYNGARNRADLYDSARTTSTEGSSKLIASGFDAASSIYGAYGTYRTNKLAYGA